LRQKKQKSNKRDEEEIKKEEVRISHELPLKHKMEETKKRIKTESGRSNCSKTKTCNSKEGGVEELKKFRHSHKTEKNKSRGIVRRQKKKCN